MPGGKAPIVGAIAWCHERTLPAEVGEPESLLKWRRSKHPGPTAEELRQCRQQIREELARYFAFKNSTPLLTETERERQIRRTRDNPEELRNLDVNSRVIADRRKRWRKYDPKYEHYKPRGRRFPDPLLVFLIHDLVPIWKEVTGRLPGTREIEHPKQGEFPFYEWIADLFQGCGKDPPKEGAIRDILARPKKKKSGP